MATPARRAANKRWREKNKEKRLAQRKRWEAKHLAERLAYSKKWAEEHRERRREKAKEYRKNNPDKIAAKKRRYRHANPEKIRAERYRYRFGITLHDYATLFEIQAGLCAICKKEPHSKRLCVDHCHTTNKVRGLLCSHCNSMIGFAKDNPNLLKLAIKYLVRAQPKAMKGA